MEEVRMDYMKRNMIQSCTVDDERLIKAIFHLRQNYAKELEKRRTTLLIDPQESIIQPIVEKMEKITLKKESANFSKEIKICKAIKMNSCPCTAKAKAGSDFCGRHAPKQ